MAQMKVLVVSPFLSGLDSGNGGGVLTFRQIATLAKQHSVSVLSYSGILGTDIEDKCVQALSQICAEVTTVPLRLNKLKVAKAVLRSLCLSHPHLATLCWQPTMQAALQQQLDKLKPDLVWIQFPQMAQYVTVCGDTPCIMDVQDAYTLSGFRQAQRGRGLGRIRALLDWVCWARYEALHYPRFATVLTLSEQDANVLRAMNPHSNATSMGLPLADGVAPRGAPVPMQVGFAGAFGHRPNIEGLDWFLNEIWPQVRARVPTARFVVAGRNPPPELVARAGDGVEFSGFVPDIFDFYASNTATVVPLVSGGGVKIKTVEAMLAGSAIVATQIGIEGTGATPGQEALIEDGATAFADSVVRILLDATLRANLANSARRLGSSSFSTEAWASRINAIFSRVIKQHAVN